MNTPTPPEGTTWLNKREVANYLSVKVRTIDYLVKRGKLPTPYAFSKRMKRWDLKEIEEHIRNIRLKEELKDTEKSE